VWCGDNDGWSSGDVGRDMMSCACLCCPSALLCRVCRLLLSVCMSVVLHRGVASFTVVLATLSLFTSPLTVSRLDIIDYHRLVLQRQQCVLSRVCDQIFLLTEPNTRSNSRSDGKIFQRSTACSDFFPFRTTLKLSCTNAHTAVNRMK